ncbi:MAG: MraY family glycosyltransferase [Candidatus Acidiferrales bacterium]
MSRANLVAAAGGFVLVVMLTPAIKALCVRWEIYDRPGPLKIHAKPIPRLGGIAVTAAILGGILLSTRLSIASVWPLLTAIILLCAVGVVDDIWGLSAATRLAAQVVAGAILWSGGGRLAALGDGFASLAATCIFAVGVINAFNFIDGADGIASGVAGLIAILYGTLPWRPGDHTAPIAAWAVAGSCAGFLLFNFPMPAARLFLGDGGSTVLGLCIAFLGLHFYSSPAMTGRLLLFPLLAAGLPLLDIALAILRRIRSRASPFFGDRDHFYDLLDGRGCTPRATALICYGVTAVFGLVGFVGMRTKAADFLVLAGLGVGLFLVVAIRLGALEQNRKRTQRAPKELTETYR